MQYRDATMHRWLLVLCAVLLSYTAAAADVHWATIGDPPVAPRGIAVQGEDLIVLSADSSVQRFTTRGWELVAAPAPERPDHVFATEDAIWVWATGRPYVRKFSAGEWQPLEPVGIPLIQLTEDAQGRMWGGDARGGAVLRTKRGWQRRGALRSYTHDSIRIVPAAGSGVWLSGGSLGLGRVTTDRFVEHGTDAAYDLLTRGTDGWPVMASSSAVVSWRDGDLLELQDQVARYGGATNDGYWLGGADRTWVVDDGRAQVVAFPGELAALVTTPGGVAFALDAGGRLHRSSPGSSPALSSSAQQWGLAAVADSPAIGTGDVDGDGLTDIVAVNARGHLRLLLQREQSFVDATRAWHLAHAGIVRDLAVCDLDGNGHDDIILRETLDDSSTRYAYLRAGDGWFDDASVRGGVQRTPSPTFTDNVGPIRCLDIDADGDLDVVLPSGEGIRRGVALLENTGYGRLREAQLPARGLGSADHRIQDVLISDLDADGTDDFVLLAVGRPHRILRGLPGHTLEDVTRQSGFALQSAAIRGWLADVDRDGRDDLVTLDAHVGPRVWKGAANMRFHEHTLASGLGMFANWGFGDDLFGLLEDLDLDGYEDLLACSPAAGCQLAVGDDESFRDVTGALPAVRDGVLGGVSLDIGNDGDLDVLLIRRGEDLLWENHTHVVVGSTITPPSLTTKGSQRSTAIARGLSWAEWQPDGLLAIAMFLPMLLGFVANRLWGSRIVVGNPIGLLLMIAIGALAYAVVVESPVPDRVAVSVIVAALTIAATWAEITLDRRRRARRVGGYRLLDKIGHGGMGTVYLAQHEVSRRKVAIKIVHPELLAREEDRRLFRREADIGSKLDDKRVVAILESGECTVFQGDQQQRTAYLVMELLHGQTLRQYLVRHGKLSVSVACTVAREVALGLATIHDAGIVHRDVKPDNVMMLPDGRVKLMDLGAARAQGSITKSKRQVLGTLGYLAPEQGRGRPPDPRSDLYGASVMLFEMLAGHRPFEAEDLVQLLQLVLESPAPDIGRVDVPDEVKGIIARGLAKAPEARFPDASAFANALEPYTIAVGIAVTDVGAMERRYGPPQLTDQTPVGRHPIGILRFLYLYARVAYDHRTRPSTLDLVTVLTQEVWRSSDKPEDRSEIADRLRALSSRFEFSDEVSWPKGASWGEETSTSSSVEDVV